MVEEYGQRYNHGGKVRVTLFLEGERASNCYRVPEQCSLILLKIMVRMKLGDK
jgi:hypothetical protein